MGFVQAAALPLASVAAWQSLNCAGAVRSGQRVLTHGAAGGLGGFAVQFARRAGAEVFATAAARDGDYVRGLGADHVIAYDRERFEDVATHSSSTTSGARSSTGLGRCSRTTGRSSAPRRRPSRRTRRRGVAVSWFMNKPDTARLQEIADDAAEGRLQSRVDAVVRFDDLSATIERIRTQPQVGKAVVSFHDG